jgi:hypothetical protein
MGGQHADLPPKDMETYLIHKTWAWKYLPQLYKFAIPSIGLAIFAQCD